MCSNIAEIWMSALISWSGGNSFSGLKIDKKKIYWLKEQEYASGPDITSVKYILTWA